MTNTPTVLVTGATGRVAGQILPYLRTRYRLRLTDLRTPDGPEVPPEQVLVGDLLSPEFVAAAIADVDAVIHLAGNAAPHAPWTALEPANVRITQQLLEAARHAPVRRVVLASSIHASGGYVRDGATPVDPSWPAHPCCLYGASKVAAEAVARVYADRYGVPVTIVRIGGAQTTRLHTPFQLAQWVSPGDLADLLTRAIDGGPAYGIYFGISANTGGLWLIDNARDELGYRPADDAECHASDIDMTANVPPCYRPVPGVGR